MPATLIKLTETETKSFMSLGEEEVYNLGIYSLTKEQLI